MNIPSKLVSLEQCDRELTLSQAEAASMREQLPREGWVRAIRKSLGMSMKAFSHRIHFKDHSSVKELERNERDGTITLQTLKRAAEAMNADFVYAIVPRTRLRETVAARAPPLAEQRLPPIVNSTTLKQQPSLKDQINPQL